MISTDRLDSLFGQPALSDRFFGVVVGVVTNNQDPDKMHRVKVRFPWLSKDVESNWARVAAQMAGNDRGSYFLPEIDDEVLIAFEHGNVDFPYVLGSLWNGKDAPPENNSDGKNNHRTIKSRSGHIVRLNDTSGGETIEIIDKSGNKIVIDASKNTVTIESQSDISIKSSTGKLTMEANGIEIKSQTDVSVQANTSMDLKASGQVTLQGAMINLN